MESESGNLQNDFFNAARKERKVVTIFLGNGKKLTGRIKSFDKFTLLLDGPQGEQIIFKHAISTVSSTKAGSERVERETGSARQPTTQGVGGPGPKI
jgi:host factor-I protein